MLLSSLRVEGLRAHPDADWASLERVHRVDDPLEGSAMADGLALLRAALVPDELPRALAHLELGRPETTHLLDDLLLDEVEHLDPWGVDALVQPRHPRQVVVQVDVTPDPLLFRQLRDLALRDPAMVAALGSGGQIHIRVGWLFNRAGTHASVAALAVRIGEERFSTAAADRPAWLPDVLRRIGERLYRLDPHQDEAALAARLLSASLSSDPTHRARATALTALLEAPPFSLGRLQVVRRGDAHLRLALGDALSPLRAWGLRALDAVRLASAIVLEQPDVLVLDTPADPAWRQALADATAGDHASLEQVLMVGGTP